MTQIRIEHDSHYQYQTEVELAHHLAYLRPMDFNGQKVVTSALDITPTPDRLTENTDTFGNRRTFFTLSIPHDTLMVRATSIVTLVDRYAKFSMQDASEWEDVRDALEYALNRPYVAQAEFTFPSPYVPRLSPLRDYAMSSFPRGRGLAQACIDLSARIHRDFTYSPAATEVNTPLLEAFEKRAGVCQDFSHILIGCLRSIGLSAKYVSGYLLTKPAPGQEKLRGADASHAWVAVYCPEAPDGWLELDPTNNVVPQLGHVRLAMGRDFGDVSPLRGVIRGGDEHVLKVGVTVEQV